MTDNSDTTTGASQHDTGRRNFLKKGGMLASAGGVAAASSTLGMPAIASERREWRMVTAWPKGFPGVGTNAERVAQLITEMSDGRLTVTVHGAGEVVPAMEVFDAVSSGTVEMGHDASFHHMGKNPIFALFTTIPFGLVGNEYAGWLLHGGGMELWDEAYAEFGLKPFMACNTGTQMFGWFREPIETVQDLRGLKFRTPGLGAAVMSQLGATVVQMPVGELFQAMQSGTVDACELVSPFNDIAIGIQQVAKNYYAPGVIEGSTIVNAVVNREKFNELPRDLQQIVRTACLQGYTDSWAEYTYKNAPAMRKLTQEHGVQLRRVPEEILRAMGDASNKVLTEMRDDGDELTRRIFDSYLSARGGMKAYTSIAEQGFLNARSLDYDYPS
ncbi:TRAP transporter substrate-binding protein [Arhodomonas sp. SL1]|uniref:TRAP transporter substrate-binding protein n=1 Tax=Arhodomonas sp. SL1 TaxID=3425691 RepID=UPI003F8825D1